MVYFFTHRKQYMSFQHELTGGKTYHTEPKPQSRSQSQDFLTARSPASALASWSRLSGIWKLASASYSCLVDVSAHLLYFRYFLPIDFRCQNLLGMRLVCFGSGQSFRSRYQNWFVRSAPAVTEIHHHISTGSRHFYPFTYRELKPCPLPKQTAGSPPCKFMWHTTYY